MANLTDAQQIKLQILVDSVGATKALNKVDKELVKLGGSAKKLSDAVSVSFKENTRAIEGSVKPLEKLDKNLKSARGAMLGFGLGTLFFGMAIQRFSGNILRSLFSVFSNFDKVQNGMQNSLLQLSASFEFLKYAIVSSLEGTLIERFIILLAELFTKIGDWASRFPQVSEALVAGFAVLFGVGTLAMIFGQITTFVAAIQGDLGTKLGLALAKITVTAGITIGAVAWAFNLLNDPNSDLLDYLTTVGLFTLGGATLGFMYGGIWGAGIGASIGFLAGGTLSVVDWIMQNSKNPAESLKNLAMDGLVYTFAGATLGFVIGGVWGAGVGAVIGLSGAMLINILETKFNMDKNKMDTVPTGTTNPQVWQQLEAQKNALSDNLGVLDKFINPEKYKQINSEIERLSKQQEALVSGTGKYKEALDKVEPSQKLANTAISTSSVNTKDLNEKLDKNILNNNTISTNLKEQLIPQTNLAANAIYNESLMIDTLGQSISNLPKNKKTTIEVEYIVTEKRHYV